MLNAHTLTQTYRDSQFDIRVFLETLRAVISESSVPLVESRWADGSVDITPTIDFISYIESSAYQGVQVGGVNIEPNRSRGALNIVGAKGVSATFADIGDSNTDVTYKDSTIDLIDAETITFQDSSTPINIDDVDSLKTSSIKVNGDSKVNRIDCTTISAQTSVDVSSASFDGSLRVNSTNEGSSQLLYYCSSTSSDVRSSIVLSGPMCLANAGPTGDDLRQSYGPISTKSCIYLQVANIGSAGYKRGDPIKIGLSAIPSEYQKTQSMYNLLGLYPKLNGEAIKHTSYQMSTNYLEQYYDYVFTLEPFSDSDNYKVIEVQNITASPITLCNVWYIRLLSGSKVDIQAGNYVVVPPYSRIDFLLLWNEFQETQTRIVRMLPMKSLESTGV